MQINVEQIIQMVTTEVVKELKKVGIEVVVPKESQNANFISDGMRTKSEVIDMSKYRTPIITENHIRKLHELTGEIVVPQGTKMTPKAREMVKEKRISVKFEVS